MFMKQVHEYLSDYKFWAGALGGVCFMCAFLVVIVIKPDKKDWWSI